MSKEDETTEQSPQTGNKHCRYGGAFHIDTATWKGGAAYACGTYTLFSDSVFLIPKHKNND